jgi:hypothetical protein
MPKVMDGDYRAPDKSLIGFLTGLPLALPGQVEAFVLIWKKLV